MLLAGLGVGAAGAAAAAGPILSLRLSGGGSPVRAPSWWDRTFLSLHAAGLSEWSRLVGQNFALEVPSGSHLLRIAAVTAFPRSGPRPVTLARSQAFSVVFESLGGPPLPATDSVYQLVHRSFPPLPLYVSAPVAVGQKVRLSAVFN